MKRLVSITVIAIIGLSSALLAQENRGRVVGRVADPSGAVVPQASVIVLNTATNIVNRSVTNSEGNFLTVLEPGTYNVTVEAQGFKKKVVSGIVVRSGAQMALEFPLEVGSAAETVTVTADVPLLETASASISQVVDRRFLDQLYVSNRNPLNLVSLTAGVYMTTYGPSSLDTQANQFTVNGSSSRNGGNEITIDGASVTVPRQTGSMTNSPTGDMVEELRVQTTMFDAAYGRSTGGVISYTTRGGTNDIHGSFETFYRNKVFNANSWSNNKYAVARPDVNRKFISGSLGGPVYIPKLYDGQNRTFFFFGIQREENRSPESVVVRTLTDKEKAGDFSSTLNSQGTALRIYDPATTIVNGSTATRSPFPGAIIPSSRFNTVGSNIAKMYPQPTIQGTPQLGVNNWAAGFESIQPGSNYSVRMDHNLSDSHRMFGRFGLMRYNGVASGGLPRAYAGYEGEFREFWLGSLNNDFIFSPTFLAAIRYSFGREATDAITSATQEDPTDLGLPDILLKNAERLVFPQIGMGDGVFGYGGRIKYRANDSHTLAPTFTRLAGNHSIRFGGDLRMINWNSRELGYATMGSFTFNNGFTRSDPFTPFTGNTTGSAIASLLLGVPASGSFGASSPYSLRQYYYAGFVQDDWKLTSKLTLNIGFRWEAETPYSERFDRSLFGFDYTVPNPVQVSGLALRGGPLFAGIQGNSRRQGRVDTNNFGPRFGFAYQLDKDTVLRGGYAMFYAPSSALVDQSSAIPATFNKTAAYVASDDGGATPFTTLSNPFPAGIPAPEGNSLGLAARLGNSLAFVDQSRVLPYSHQWQFGIQRALPGKIRLEANFVRMLSLKLPENFNLNEKPDQYLSLGSAENTTITNPFYGTFPLSSPLGSSAKIAQRQLWLVYPQYSGLTVVGASTGMVPYNSLQINLDKRLSHGLTLIGNLSISKQMQSNVTSLVNTRHYRSVSSMDRSKLSSMAFVCDLPFGKGRTIGTNLSGLAGFLVSNWGISGRLTLASGVPLQITDANGRPIRLRNAAKSGPVNERLGDRLDPTTKAVLNPYFDTTAFQSLPNQFTISPEPPYFGELRGPGTTNLDLSLLKRFRIGERISADVRADASNFTNTPLFAAPGTNMSNKGTFGVITTAQGWAARFMQLAFRMVF